MNLRTLKLVGRPSQLRRLTHDAWGCATFLKAYLALEAARRDLEDCSAPGTGVLRFAFSWFDIDPSPSQYDFTFWDDSVRLAADNYRFRLVCLLHPEWAASSEEPDAWRYPPGNPDTFAPPPWVDRYKSQIHFWGLWNEPDNRACWTGTPAQYAAIVKAGSAEDLTLRRGTTTVPTRNAH